MLKKTRKFISTPAQTAQYVRNGYGERLSLRQGKLFRKYDDNGIPVTQFIYLRDLAKGLRKKLIEASVEYNGRNYVLRVGTLCYKVGTKLCLRIGCQHFWGANAEKILRAARVKGYC
jgi:hypothetical protein